MKDFLKKWRHGFERVIFSSRTEKFLKWSTTLSVGVAYVMSVILIIENWGTPAMAVGMLLFFLNTGTFLMRFCEPAFYGLGFWKFYFAPWAAIADWRKAKARHAELVELVTTGCKKLYPDRQLNLSTWSVPSLESYLAILKHDDEITEWVSKLYDKEQTASDVQ